MSKQRNRDWSAKAYRSHRHTRFRGFCRFRRGGIAVLIALAAGLTGCHTARGPSEAADDQAASVSHDADVEAVSLLGRPLKQIVIDDETRGQLQANLAEARAKHDADPRDEMAIIWLGRRLAYLGRYREAIEVYTEGLEIHPESYRLLRHRGHRYITTRQFDRAIADLSRAAALAADEPDRIEPDGAPNRFDIPRSTTKTNIHYHLGLAHYLRGEYETALGAWQQCAALSPNDDMLIASLYWVYLSARRCGDNRAANAAMAQVEPVMDLMENRDYHKLLVLFSGKLDERDVLGDDSTSDLTDATLGYGVAMKRLLDGDEHGASAMFERIVDDGFWPAFGYIAAEAELARMRR